MTNFVFFALGVVVASESFGPSDPVEVLVNTVGPYNNFAETYDYYTLPFCTPDKQTFQGNGLSEFLAGDRRKVSMYDINFGVEVHRKTVCHKTLGAEQQQLFQEAVLRDYTFEMFVDELGVKAFVGPHRELEDPSSVYTHLQFSIAYNGNQIVAVNLTAHDPLPISSTMDFLYSVSWVHTDNAYEDRLEVHNAHNRFKEQVEIHWLSIINSFVLVVLLVALLAVILVRILKKDFARYLDLSDLEDADDEDGFDEYGWKLLHGDVFRAPFGDGIFAAAVGVGLQIFVLVVVILFCALLGTFYPGNRGALYSAVVVTYSLTSGVAGYTSAKLYKQFGGAHWLMNAILTAMLFFGPSTFVFAVVNTVAITYNASSALPFGTIMVVIVIWFFVGFPLTILGAIRGKMAEVVPYPCKTNAIAREMPPQPWYLFAPIHLLGAGILPFSAIYIELHYMFTSIWGHETYTLFGILVLAFLLLLLVTAAVTLALTYFQLAAENYRWRWRAFLSAASCGLFIYGYAIYYYNFRSEMTGLLQATFFFGYTALLAYAFALMLGSLGYFVSNKFVCHIYKSIHVD
mmetsp:Transcript_50499/g.98953  ORF Transcript_50499/g.98953 Transcript_50499/m.98953 type:complete len:572 (-) Transcript_50499:288-2003(-)